MTVETEVAILTKLLFEQNNEMKARMSAAQGSEKDLVALVMPLFRMLAPVRRREAGLRDISFRYRTLYEMKRREKSGGSAGSEPDSAR